ncbi:MAG: 30S ribosome-binding factor RbfA [Verrucomicrobia bacterium]|nr:30S ribosome-binding factor RbfA [Verrucomicrobiota bacterium]NBU09689.1 30S ribosome-binding factor RbfA [Pseudomonadota bacterium]NDA67265.1 30S ribosome-binding factor RbfA [Verrucomicrobiota bacterium]NDB76681.1 30S ribosome-binding factor RbfA [Verrucomicrobiota bacterium]NDD39090.1 30S ribosome-binding factor RbfA [Verrucomicrobiota bacterium]
MKVRLERVREMLKRTLGEIIRRDFPPDADNGLITVADVTVTPDLKEAQVYIGVVGKAEAKKRAMNRLNGNRGQIQFELGRSIVLRYTPKIEFHLDESVERGNRVLSILEELEKQAPPK